MPEQDSKRCSGPCRKVKPLTDFHRDSEQPDGRQYYCKVCRKLYDKVYYQQHRKARRAQMKARDAAHPAERRASSRERQERIRAQETRLTKTERDAYVQQIGECMACGATEGLTFEHVIPLSKGGEDSLDNAAVLCRTHNVAKGDKMIDYRPIWESQRARRREITRR